MFEMTDFIVFLNVFFFFKCTFPYTFHYALMFCSSLDFVDQLLKDELVKKILPFINH